MKKSRKGNLYLSERCVRKLLCRILHYNGIKDSNGKEYGVKSVKQYIANTCGEQYRDAILNLANLQNCTNSAVDGKIKEILIALCGDGVFRYLPDVFMESAQEIHTKTGDDNIYFDKSSGLSIMFDTVYGVKAETYDATLYLETETMRSTDIKRIMPLLDGKDIKDKKEIHEKSRRCGFSRPKYLLCLAIGEKTYKGHEKAFESWKVRDLRECKCVENSSAR